MLARLLWSLILILLLQLPSLSQEIPIPFQAVPGQPYFSSPEIMIDSAEYDTLILQLEAKQSGTARLFWATSYDMQFNQPKSIWFSVKSGKHNYYFNISSQNPNWIGWIKGFLIYPEIDLNLLKITQAKVIKGNLLTNIKSGWQEFWGPRGRVIIGSTINTIQSSNLFGQSIFVYIYWIIGLIILGYFSFEIYKWSRLRKKPPFEMVISNIGKAAFMTVVVFWGFLEVSGWYNNWLQVKSDWKYVGKSYEEKLILANTGDFYPFIQFCKKNLPLGAMLDLRVPPFYNDIKARYYLYPRQMTTTEAEYLVVYDMDVEKEAMAKYSPWKTFREKAYIMRKK